MCNPRRGIRVASRHLNRAIPTNVKRIGFSADRKRSTVDREVATLHKQMTWLRDRIANAGPHTDKPTAVKRLERIGEDFTLVVVAPNLEHLTLNIGVRVIGRRLLRPNRRRVRHANNKTRGAVALRPPDDQRMPVLTVEQWGSRMVAQAQTLHDVDMELCGLKDLRGYDRIQEVLVLEYVRPERPEG